jgi:hypothetical protein
MVIVMGVLIIGGTVTLVAMLVQRAGGGAAGSSWQAALAQPEGARIAGIAGTDGGIGVWVQRPDGDRVVVVEPKLGKVIGEIRLGR